MAHILPNVSLEPEKSQSLMVLPDRDTLTMPIEPTSRSLRRPLSTPARRFSSISRSRWGSSNTRNLGESEAILENSPEMENRSVPDDIGEYLITRPISATPTWRPWTFVSSVYLSAVGSARHAPPIRATVTSHGLALIPTHCHE